MFLARYPENEIAQLKSGSTTIDKLLDLAPFGVVSSPGGLTFVPAGHRNPGSLKIVSWPSGEWYEVTIAPDALGTFDIVAATEKVTMPGGPEGFVYIPPNSPLLPGLSLLVSEFNAGEVAAFELNDDGDPIIATRKAFLTGLEGAEGAVTDPQTGDYIFSTFGGGSRVILVQGFASPLGAPCEGADDCSSGFCADGVCCISACAGSCDACGDDGPCEPVTGGACEVEDACTVNATCLAGLCVGQPVSCAPSNECHASIDCDPASGCQEVALDDGAVCNNGGQCSGGFCTTPNAQGEGEKNAAVAGCSCRVADASSSSLGLLMALGLWLRRRSPVVSGTR